MQQLCEINPLNYWQFHVMYTGSLLKARKAFEMDRFMFTAYGVFPHKSITSQFKVL